jgi:hypothetical protein
VNVSRTPSGARGGDDPQVGQVDASSDPGILEGGRDMCERQRQRDLLHRLREHFPRRADTSGHLGHEEQDEPDRLRGLGRGHDGAQEDADRDERGRAHGEGDQDADRG